MMSAVVKQSQLQLQSAAVRLQLITAAVSCFSYSIAGLPVCTILAMLTARSMLYEESRRNNPTECLVVE